MSSQFDALLDFGDEPTPSTKGTTQAANGSDDFDPFGAGAMDSGKSGSGDAGLLLDFSVGGDTSGKAENGTGASTTAPDLFDSDFTLSAKVDVNNSSNSANNLFYDMSATESQPSSNPLYDLMDDDLTGAHQKSEEDSSANPLYDLSEGTGMDFTFETTTTTVTESSANPLYDLMDSENTDAAQEQEEEPAQPSDSLDFLSSLPELGSPFGRKVMEKSTPSEDIVVEANNQFVDEVEEQAVEQPPEEEEVEDQVVPDVADVQESGPRTSEDQEEVGVEQAFEDNVELFIREEGEEQRAFEVDDGGEAAVEQQEEEEMPQEEEVEEAREEMLEVQQPEKARSRSRSPSNHSISSEGEVLNEEEDLRQDGRTIYKSKEQESFNETRYDGQPAEGYGRGDVTDYGLENGNIAREHQEKDFHFHEMSSVKNQFEHGGQQQTQYQQRQPIDLRKEAASSEGGVYESQPQTFTPQWGDTEPEEGVYENQPEHRPDVARESDRNIGAELPSVGTAKNIREKFLKGDVENKVTERKRERSPPVVASGGVYESEPKYNPDVVHSGEPAQEEILPEHGTAKNLAARFKEMEKQGAVPLPSQGKREITPDRTGKVEYVSEPRGFVEKYEPQVQAGVFESQPASRDDVVKSDELPEEVLPERGSAKNIAARFKQMSTSDQGHTPRGKRELTPDTSGRVEYVSEPTGYVEKYEGKSESGVFESQPAGRDDVVKSDQLPEEILPERGTAKNLAARWKEMEKSTKSPPSPSKHKEFTPPRENGTPTHGVYESTPKMSEDVVHSGDQAEDILPERGTARNIADRFRQLGSSENAPKSPRAKKEFTPPPNQTQAVYENQPKQFIPDYNKPAESGILESKPEVRDDVVRETGPNYEQELPERGYTRNLVSAWKQRESESTKISPTGSGRPKEFTPPREEPRVASQRNQPRTPKSPLARQGDMDAGSVHPTDLPGQYQPQAEPTVFESEPERLEGVVSENDTDWSAGLPKADTTKKMLARFQQIQAQAQADASAPRPQSQARNKEGEDGENGESTDDKVGRSKSMRVAVQLEKCGACDKTVYVMEKIEIEKQAYHKACFRCSHCHCILTPKTFAINQKVMFCTTHYKQLFATKGNYDEGFGHDQHKKRWKSEPNLAEDEQQQQQHSNHT